MTKTKNRVHFYEDAEDKQGKFVEVKNVPEGGIDFDNIGGGCVIKFNIETMSGAEEGIPLDKFAQANNLTDEEVEALKSGKVGTFLAIEDYESEGVEVKAGLECKVISKTYTYAPSQIMWGYYSLQGNDTFMCVVSLEDDAWKIVFSSN